MLCSCRNSSVFAVCFRLYFFAQRLILNIDQQINGRGSVFPAKLPSICVSNSLFQGILRVSISQGIQTDMFFLRPAFQRQMFACFDLVSLFPQKTQIILPVLGLSLHQIVQDRTKLIADGMPLRILSTFAALCIRLFLDNGITMLKADNVRKSLERQPGEEKVLEFPITGKRRRIKDDVVMNMGLVRMGGDGKGVLSLREPHSQLAPQPICILRRDLSRLKGLSDLIGDDISFVFLTGNLLILPLGKQEFHGRRLRLAGIGSDQLALFCFDGILRIVQTFR